MKEGNALLKYKCLHHVSLSVTDLERAKHFYGSILCLKEIPRPPFDFPGAWYDIQGSQLHLIVEPASQTIRPNKSFLLGEGHFALRVEDYDETVKWLKQNNVEILEIPQSISGFAQIFCVDPDGNLIELNAEQKDL